jgi:hypothetical protein
MHICLHPSLISFLGENSLFFFVCNLEYLIMLNVLRCHGYSDNMIDLGVQQIN